jgi:predicted glycosyltransferase
MNILIDIGHPAHVHLFKNFAVEMMAKGNYVLFTVRDKEHERYLLDINGFKYISLGKHYNSIPGKILGLFLFNLKILKTSLSFKPDMFLSHGSVYSAHVAWLLGKPNITLEDTGNMEQILLYLPFTSVILTSDVFHRNLGKKQIRYIGYHELAYLHPRRFLGNRNIRKIIRVRENEKFFLLRFISWDASHDKGQTGFSIRDKKELIEKLASFGKVFISSEKKLPQELVKYQINIPPETMHDVLAAADLFVGEGATMASECAMLGTPAIYVNSMEAGTINDQEKNGLLFHFRNFVGVLDKATEILNNPNSRREFKEKRDRMLKDKIDVTAFLIWFVQNYPESIKIMKENPDYQNNFK